MVLMIIHLSTIYLFVKFLNISAKPCPISMPITKDYDIVITTNFFINSANNAKNLVFLSFPKCIFKNTDKQRFKYSIHW